MKTYDKEAIYDDQLSPLMSQIIEVCMKHQIPMVADFQFANDEEYGPVHCTTTLPLEGIADDKLVKAAKLLGPRCPVCLVETHTTNPDDIAILHALCVAGLGRGWNEVCVFASETVVNAHLVDFNPMGVPFLTDGVRVLQEAIAAAKEQM